MSVNAPVAKQSFKRSRCPLCAVGMMLTLLFLSSGCAVINHLEELFVVGDYSRDKDNQQKSIKQVNAHYDALVATIASKGLKLDLNQTDVRMNFGEPISIKVIDVEGQKQEQWLYRYAIISTAKDKVYLYFDQKAKLIKFAQEKIEW
ncbi:MAG: hypothetical protein WCH62_00055 [Candidatus Omnitrophota bacterium]